AALAMRHARRECRIESIDVERDVDRRLELQLHAIAPAAGFDHFHAKTFELLAMLIADSAQAYLHQPVRKPLLHDSCEWRRMRSRVVLIRVIDIGMRVDVQNREARVAPTYCT